MASPNRDSSPPLLLSPIYSAGARETPPEIMWSGRINAVAINPNDVREVIAGSDSGGLFRSRDGGLSWTHLDSLPANQISDLQFVPRMRGLLFVTAKKDFRDPNGGGIWRSSDSGTTWTQVVSLPIDPSHTCAGGFENIDGHPGAWGIHHNSVTRRLYVATSCGLLVSDESGERWSRIDGPSAGTPWPNSRFVAVETWSHREAVAGGADGIWYRDASGIWTEPTSGTWRKAAASAGSSLGPVLGPRAMSRSPYRIDLFVVTGTAATAQLFFSTTSGRTWRPISMPPIGDGAGAGGVPFVYVTRAPNVKLPDGSTRRSIYIYYGNGYGQYRVRVSGTAPGRFDYARIRVADWTNLIDAWVAEGQGHADTRALAFEPGAQIPSYWGNDGGLYRKTRSAPVPRFELVGSGLGKVNALQVQYVSGEWLEGRDEVYFGTQDNFIWGTSDWTHSDIAPTFVNAPSCSEGFAPQMWPTPVSRGQARLATASQPGGVKLSGPLFSDIVDWPEVGWAPFVLGTYQFFQQEFDDSAPAEEQTIWKRVDVTSTPHRVTILARLPARLLVASGEIKDTTRGHNVWYGVYNGASADGKRLLRLLRIDARSSPARVELLPDDDAGFGGLGLCVVEWNRRPVFGVDPGDWRHLIAYDVVSRTMKTTWDGGGRWEAMPDLDALLRTGGHVLDIGAMDFTSDVSHFPLAGEIRFNPWDERFVLVGTNQNGAFFSSDRGRTWTAVHRSKGAVRINGIHWIGTDRAILASYGRGLWEVSIAARVPDLIDVCGDACRIVEFAARRAKTSKGAWRQLRSVPLRSRPVRSGESLVVVANGTVTDLSQVSASLVEIFAPPGSHLITVGQAGWQGRLRFKKQQTVGAFKGFEAAIQIARAENLFVTGVLLGRRGVVGIVLSPRPFAVTSPPAPLPSDVNSGILVTPNLRTWPHLLVTCNDCVGGLSIPGDKAPVVYGSHFNIDASLRTTITLDDEETGSAVQLSANGDFRVSVPGHLSEGAHRVTVRQTRRQKTVFSLAAGFQVAHTDEEA